MNDLQWEGDVLREMPPPFALLFDWLLISAYACYRAYPQATRIR